ncbi:MAG: calcium/sodium antiporter [Lachnospiraceae bacterium]|nr:calcium/sodium antiporter [Lachnospiraceae bacterium]
MLSILLLVIGFVLLIKGADLFVDGSSSVAKILKVPSVIIGLTIVSLGTSAPEAAVSISAGLKGNNDIALSNVVGSNIFNLLLVIGISAIITPFLVDKDIKKRDLPINIILTTVLLIFTYTGQGLSRVEGILFLITMVIYILVLIKNAMKNKVEVEEEAKILSIPKSIIFIFIGIAAIIFGGDLVVDSATAIAKSLGVSDLLIGLTIVAIGTSLPELVTSVIAAKKGESGLALGNAVGSSIFNIIFILGLSSTLSPIGVAKADFNFVLIDLFVLLVVGMLIQVFCISREKVSRFEGIFCTVVYVAYTAYIIMRTIM